MLVCSTSAPSFAGCFHVGIVARQMPTAGNKEEKNLKHLLILLPVLMFAGCAVAPQPNYHAEESYQQREEIKASLFDNDNSQISNEAAEKILGGKVTLSTNSRVALLKLPTSSWQAPDTVDA
ncbi:MAG: hypothetical protein CME36_12080 [unclassified Hahellaceae]|nr:hypothetical protein [Hahellaceae bacterium]